MKHKRWLLISLMLIFSLLLISCGGGEATTDTEESTPADTTESADTAEEDMVEEEADTAVEDVAAEADVANIEQIRIAVGLQLADSSCARLRLQVPA